MAQSPELDALEVTCEMTSSTNIPRFRYRNGGELAIEISKPSSSVADGLRHILALRGSANAVIVELMHLTESDQDREFHAGTSELVLADKEPRQLHYEVTAETTPVGDRLTFEAPDQRADSLNLDSGHTLNYLLYFFRTVGKKTGARIFLKLTPAVFSDKV